MTGKELDKAFGEIVLGKRKKLGITRERLAELVGISSVHCRNIEIGKSRTSWVIWVKICTVLNIDIAYITETYINPEINEAGEFLGIKI